MTAHALFIGTNQYSDRSVPPLHCAQRDASELYHLFKRELGYGEHAHLLEAPKQEEVYEQLDAIGRQVHAGDNFLLYFAGHGAESADGQDQFLLLSGARMVLLENARGTPAGTLSVRELVAVTDEWPGVQRVMVFDACRTRLVPTMGVGQALHGLPVFGSEKVLQLIATRDVLLRRERPRPRTSASAPPASAGPLPTVFIKSCQSNQLAVELLAYQRSMFGLAFDQVLKQARDAGQAVLTNSGLLKELTERMARLAAEHGVGAGQRPWMSEAHTEAPLYLPLRGPAHQESPGDLNGRSAPARTLEIRREDPWQFATAARAATGVGTLILAGWALHAWWPGPIRPAESPAVAATPAAALQTSPPPAKERTGSTPPNAEPAAQGSARTAATRQFERGATGEPSLSNAATSPDRTVALKTPAASPAEVRGQPAAAEPTPAPPPSARYVDMAALPVGKSAVMAAQGSADLVAQVRRHLPPSQLKVFRDLFFSDGSFDRVMSGDGAPIAGLDAEHRVSVFRFLRIDEPHLSQPRAEFQGAVEATTTVHFREVDPATGGTLRSSRIELRGAGFSREKALKDLQRDLEDKAVQLN